MTRTIPSCAAGFTPIPGATHSRPRPASDFHRVAGRRLDSTTLGQGTGMGLNDAGRVLVLADTAAPGIQADSTFVWSTSKGVQEVRFEGTTAATRGSALSESGFVAGQAVSPRGTYEGFIWSELSGVQ